MTPFILISDGFDKNLFQKLKENSNFQVHPESKVSREELWAYSQKLKDLSLDLLQK